MVKFSVIIAIVVLIASLFLLFDKLFTPQPIQIILESGQEVTTSTPDYFSLVEVLLMIISAFLIGTASIYLFYNSNGLKNPDIYNHLPKQEQSRDKYNIIMPLLKQEEKYLIKALQESNGEMQQNKLVVKLGVSKVKATRILYSLEQKDLILKQRHGLTNLIKLKK